MYNVFRRLDSGDVAKVSIFKTEEPRFKTNIDAVPLNGSKVAVISTGILKEMSRLWLQDCLTSGAMVSFRLSALHVIFDIIQFMHDNDLNVYQFATPKTHKYYRGSMEFLSERFQLKNLNHRLETTYHGFDMYGASQDKTVQVAFTEFNTLP